MESSRSSCIAPGLDREPICARSRQRTVDDDRCACASVLATQADVAQVVLVGGLADQIFWGASSHDDRGPKDRGKWTGRTDRTDVVGQVDDRRPTGRLIVV